MTGSDERAAGTAVVVGAGVGGLASAMRLAHAGLDVTVVDRAAAPGGKMRAVESDAGPVDAGPTVLTMRYVFDRLFADVGLELSDYATLIPERVLARHYWPDGSTLDLFADPDESAAAVRAFAGRKSEAEFRAFCAEAQRLFQTFDAPMMQAEAPSLAGLSARVALRPGLIPALAPLSTLARRLARRFSDPRLRQLFGRYATYVGGSPFEAPAVLSLIWHAEASGVWRAKGGMHALAQGLTRAAERLGVRFRLNTEVARIEAPGGRVNAIALADGTRLPCDLAVFNGDPRALTAGLLGESVECSVAEAGTEPRSLSANVWAFAARYTGPELAHHTVFFGADPKREFAPIAAGALPEDPTLYICAQDRGAGTVRPEIERFEIIMNAPPLPGGQPEDTELCRIRTFQTLARHGVRFSPEPDPAMALTTPAGFNALFPASQGSLYGR
ncbi:MAG: 1-hydroxycarotenoid 3,4-desaturase CrtD, partial [Pseudomonadota bacterium]